MTSPLKDTEVVLGKFVASWIMLFVMLLLTLIFPLITARFGNLDIGPVISGYWDCYCSVRPFSRSV